jgi:predicted membrane channel-forming protein YqfA (hemolysin III family)
MKGEVMNTLLVVAIVLATRSIISIIVLWNAKDKTRATYYLSLGIIGTIFSLVYTAIFVLKDYRKGKLQPNKVVFEPKEGFKFTSNK